MSMPRVFISADHGGFELKEMLRGHLAKKGYTVQDFGTHSTAAVDYPDLAFLVAQAVAGNNKAGGDARGIIVDSIGQASCMVANKVPGIRAAVAIDAFCVNSSREHNDANVLCLGGQVHGPGLARHLVDVWLEAPYAGGRHQRRVDMISEIEKRVGGK
jgi:ribose 5-phosphate isomerase B